MDGDAVVQAYIEYPNQDRMPLKELKGFKRVSVLKGGKQTATISVPVKDLQKWDLTNHKWKLYPGSYKLIIGENSRDEKISIPIQITD